MLQASIPSHVDVSDDAAILALARDNPDCKLEISPDGHILVSALTGTQTGPKEVEAIVQLHAYAKSVGGKAFSSQAGFRLADTSVVGPDASWISAERLAGLTPEATRTAFWRVCPNVVIEVRSESDTWKAMCRKIDRYIENGADYAIAIDCEKRNVYERGVAPSGLGLDIDRIIDA